jgi:hypothetical protein
MLLCIRYADLPAWMSRRAFFAPPNWPHRFVPSRAYARLLLDHTDDYRHDGDYGGKT